VSRLRAASRWVAPLVVGTAMAALIAAGALALQTTLRGPTSADALALRVVAELQRLSSIGSDLNLSGFPTLHARCTVHGKIDKVVLSDGTRLDVARAGVFEKRGLWRSPDQIAAEAALAACPRLLVGDISRRLFAGKRVIDGRLSFDGGAAYRVRIDLQPPTLFLIVSRRDLTPLAVGLRGGRRFRGASRLLGARFAPVGTGKPAAGSPARDHAAP
jgi:hypothetical protein